METTYLQYGDIYPGKNVFKHPITREVVDVCNPRMEIIYYQRDNTCPMDTEAVVLNKTVMLRSRRGHYILGWQIPYDIPSTRTYFVYFYGTLIDGNKTYELCDEDRFKIINFETVVPHYHISPTQITALSYNDGCWVLPSPFTYTGDNVGSSNLFGYTQSPDMTINTTQGQFGINYDFN